MTSLLPVLLPGLVIGGLLSYGTITWIQKSQLNGILYLSLGPTLVILAYLAAVYVISCSSIAMEQFHVCTMILAGDAIDCGYKFFVLQSTTDFVLWAIIYIWGIRFEGRSNLRLVYKFRLIR
jgi:hypothetical protein